MLWLYLAIAVFCVLLFILVLLPGWVIWSFVDRVGRIFQEKPLFYSPRGQPVPDAEDLRFPTSDGLMLTGCYWKTQQPRRGVILFGLEFGSNRWACVPYCEFLQKSGFDIFTFEMRGQGDSPCPENYEPLQWVTDHEVRDFRAALAYLKARPDADPQGVGLFGLSRGGSAGLIVAADDPYIRCAVCDGIYATHTTMLPYMRKWLTIYTMRPWVAPLVLPVYFRIAAYIALSRLSREKKIEFPRLEYAMPRFAPRPLLMIHGGADTYIKPSMAQRLFKLARKPKELWIVEGAKHNQAFHRANEEYQKRVLDFFHANLVGLDEEPAPAQQGVDVRLPEPVR